MKKENKEKCMKKVTIEMACSINGLIATEDGNEDFLSYRGWEIMIEFLIHAGTVASHRSRN